MRALSALALALLLASPVAADDRWVALWLMDGNAGFGTQRTTGPPSNVYTAHHYRNVETALRRMGVPFRVFSYPDSANWGTSSATPTKADSTWFREQGCMGMVLVNLSSAGSYEQIRFFTDAAGNRGVQRGSPLDGNWGIPVANISLSPFIRQAGISLETGGWGDVTETQAQRSKGMTGAGDSLEIGTSLATKDPSQSSVSVEFWGGDSLSLGTWMTAWKYGSGSYGVHYYTADGLDNEFVILLALNKLFTLANYRPPNKLIYRLDIHHPFPNLSARRWLADSLAKYVRNNGWRVAAAVNAAPAERSPYGTDSLSYPAVIPLRKLSRDGFMYGHMHSHTSGYGNFHNGPWDVTTWSDTSTIRQRINFMANTVEDTVGVRHASGDNLVASLPAGSMGYPQAYILAQAGYKGMIGSAVLDSAGHPSANAQIPSAFDLRPRIWIEPKTGKAIWILGYRNIGGANDTTWTITIAGATNDQSRTGWLRYCNEKLFSSVIEGGTSIWHGDVGLSGPDDAYVVLLRRLRVMAAKLDRVVEIGDRFSPLVPAPRGRTARP